MSAARMRSWMVRRFRNIASPIRCIILHLGKGGKNIRHRWGPMDTDVEEMMKDECRGSGLSVHHSSFIIHHCFSYLCPSVPICGEMSFSSRVSAADGPDQRSARSCAQNGPRTSNASCTRTVFALCSVLRHRCLEQSPIRFVPHHASSTAEL